MRCGLEQSRRGNAKVDRYCGVNVLICGRSPCLRCPLQNDETVLYLLPVRPRVGLRQRPAGRYSKIAATAP